MAEQVQGEIIGTTATGKPMVTISYDDLLERKKAPPEMQYALMKQHYLDNTDRNAFVTSGEISDMIASVCYYRRSGGRYQSAPKFVSAAELQGAVDAYFQVMYEAAQGGSELIPDVEHLRLFLGVNKSTMARWKRENPDFDDVLAEAYDRVLAVKKQLAMHNKIPQLVYMNDIQNNHGYRQKDKPEERTEDKPIVNVDQLIEAAKYLPG